MGFLQDWLSVQFDPAHLLSEFNFELVQFLFAAIFWKKYLKPRFVKDVHQQIDDEHGVEHKIEQVLDDDPYVSENPRYQVR